MKDFSSDLSIEESSCWGFFFQSFSWEVILSKFSFFSSVQELPYQSFFDFLLERYLVGVFLLEVKFELVSF